MPKSTPSTATKPGDILLELAATEMMRRLKESQWYRTSPDGRNDVEPSIEITGVETRQVHVSMGIIGMGQEDRLFVIGRTTICGISAELSMQASFGGGTGLSIREGEGDFADADARKALQDEFIRLRAVNVPKTKYRYEVLDEINTLAELKDNEALRVAIERMRSEYTGTRLEKFIDPNYTKLVKVRGTGNNLK
jgi:hypothetical protein